MNTRIRILPLVVAYCLSFAWSAKGQQSDIEELKAALKSMQQMVEQQNARIAALEAQLEKSGSEDATSSDPVDSNSTPAIASASGPSVPDAAMEVPVAPRPSLDLPKEKSRVRDTDNFVDQQTAAPRENNVPLDPNLTGFIPIPGTESLFKIGGSARVDAITDSENNGNPNQFVPSSFPMSGEDGNVGGSRSTIHTKATRLSFEFRRPTPLGSSLRIYSEFDFFGNSSSNSMDFRARHFYGQAWNFLIGQTFSAFMDGDAFPDTVDYETPNGILNRRVPQIRYTHPLSDGPLKTLAFFSFEQPDGRVDLSAGDAPSGAAGINRLPDGVVGFRVEGESGHLQTSALLRQLSYDSESGLSDDTLGWGASMSGVLNLLAKDKLSLQVSYGEGMSRYVNDLSGLDLDAAYVNGSLEPIPALAVMAGFTHHWSDHWRSTVTGGYVGVDAPESIGGAALDSTLYSSVNLMWQPSKSFRVGFEYLFGIKETLDGAERNGHRLNFVVRYDLVR